MKRSVLVLAAFVASSLTAAPAPAQEVQYWGLWGTTARGLIYLQGQYYTIGKGDEIGGLGSVQEVTADTLIVERALTGVEQQALTKQGRVVPDVEIRRIPNVGNRLAIPLKHGNAESRR
jgi:hypothetical protein